MSKAKSIPVDPSTTTAEAFLAGGVPPAATPMPVHTEPPTPPVPGEGKPEPVAPPAAEVPPARPGLETPAQAIQETDPFVLIKAWKLVNAQGSPTFRSLRALEIPGGCIVRHSTVTGSVLTETICWIPDGRIENGELRADQKPAA